ncbi:hypothetical protein [Pseudobacteriovorax antillogorgiicola]|uniref:Uncharacterized protein n=1 Tax=Pseudobacteriovorax antillogorgiicola TaxID=1513793 RepID=A0A1Y6CIH2_9BACT|nr:hypothetical protein [Pseudobacteriovorax antillogorgiicola]TCS48310.1 hypothetical protein EDD56_11890 [Pseudobacteriovorax antillogorgiicola]SMF56684.1 hypothetical protein SAMN06296036_11851 [Pseudobacteriovorax antillogorgiicola]
MKLLSVLALFGLSVPAFAGSVKVIRHVPEHQVIRVEVGEWEEFDQRDFDRYMRRVGYDYKAHHYANRRLRQRVRTLEQAVQQLQETVYQLQVSQQDQDRGSRYVCVIKTSMHGTFMAKDSSRLGAQGKVHRKCEKEASEFWCKDAKMSCEAEG